MNLFNFIIRIKNYIYRKIESLLYSYYKPSLISTNKFVKKLKFKSKKEFINHFSNKDNIKLFNNFINEDNYSIRYFKKNYASECSNIIKIAENFIYREISLHGFKFSKKNKILWHNDPVTKCNIPIKFWKNYNFNTNSNIISDSHDPIILLKLHTHQHLIRYIQAYQLTKNKVFLDKCILELDEWIDLFPIGFGYPYLVPLNVAQRIISWTIIYQMLSKNKIFINSIFPKFLNSLSAQINFLSKNLSLFGQTNNFLLCEITAMIFSSIVFEEFPSSKGHLKKYEVILEKEILKQICDDGTSIENSTGYHRFVAELFILLVSIKKVSKSMTVKLDKILEGLMSSLISISGPDRDLPHIGDISLERVFWFEESSDITNINEIMNLSSYLLDNNEYRYHSKNKDNSIFWFFGVEAIKKNNQQKKVIPSENSRIFINGGYAVMRNGWNDSSGFQASLDCGDVGLNGNGGHGHNDFSSFCLWFNNKKIIVDRGTFTYFYSRRKRNQYRSTKHHNNVMVDNYEIAEFGSGLFQIKNQTFPEIKHWKTNNKSSSLSLSHRGYSNLKDPVAHTRNFFLDNDSFYIQDVLIGKDIHNLNWMFYIDSYVNVEQYNKKHLILTLENSIKISMILITETIAEFKVNNSTLSNSYGKELSTKCISINIDSTLPVKLVIKFEIYNNETIDDKIYDITNHNVFKNFN